MTTNGLFNRRTFIRILGSTAVVAAAGGGSFALTREPGRALVPWQAAGRDYDEPRRRALSYALLAPNPHNRQPWLVDLPGEDEIILYCDLDRLLPETDPENRQIVIGLGCFLELLRQAAAEDGYAADISPFPEGADEGRLDRRPVARIRLRRVAGQAKDPLFRYVPSRRSNKEPYDTERPVEAEKLAGLAAAAGGRADVRTASRPDSVAALRDLTWRAHLIETETPRTYMESVRLMRIGKTEIDAQPDGIDLGGPFLETLNLLGVLNRQTVADPTTDAYRQGLDMYRAITGSAMAYVWLTTSGNRRRDQLEAGRAYVRLNLKATEMGLAMHPLSQALQEYPEMDDPRAALDHHLRTPPGHRMQMLARLGYGPEVGPSPRWSLDSRVMRR